MVVLQVVDARAAVAFAVKMKPSIRLVDIFRGGQSFFKDNLQADGRFKDAEQLRAEWLQKLRVQNNPLYNVDPGVTTCRNLLALEIAGLSGAALYPGSW